MTAMQITYWVSRCHPNFFRLSMGTDGHSTQNCGNSREHIRFDLDLVWVLYLVGPCDASRITGQDNYVKDAQKWCVMIK